MALFDIARKLSFDNEGGWVNDPNDLGAETYRGISRKYNPQWNGWAYIDSLKKLNVIKKGYTDATADGFAQSFYKTNFWDKMQLDSAISQDNANQMYDHSLSGLPRAIEEAKAILKRKFNQPVVEDSVMTSSDMAILNSVPQQDFFNEYKQVRSDFFKYSAAQLAPKDSVYGDIFVKFNKSPKATNSIYVPGWLNRVNKYTWSGIQSAKAATEQAAATAIAEVKKKPLTILLITIAVLVGSYIVISEIKKI